MRVKYPSWPLPKAMDWLSTKGLGGEPQIDEIDAIVRRYERYRAILSSVDGISRMNFHRIAFDDVIPCNDPHLLVVKVANCIREGLEKPRA